MEEINRHIVSSLKWNTTFDQREEGFKLQERLSHWSKISLPGEAAFVFNELCPPEQSWRIESLEIDLGICDYSDLEFDLSTKIRTLLKEKIEELIIYQNHQKQNLISVYNKEKSILENLTVFLIEGFLPWSYQNKEGSVNQIMAELLQNNLAEIIAIIKKEGIKHEQVRKRISWQFDEKNVNKIITALEPNNSDTIIEFSSILTTLQVKETIIQTSTASFRKNLYFFILNFLLLERGTLFNKVAFMKSSILQMANHYNIAYSELIVLIENTVVKISDNTTRNNDFIYTLKMLTQEYEAQKMHHAVPQVQTNYWHLLEKLLTHKSERKLRTQKNDLNELIAVLNSENPSKFKTLLNRVLQNETAVFALIEDLDENAIKILFSKLDTDSSSLNLDSVLYLNALSSVLKLKNNPKFLWQTSIAFLIKNKNAAHNTFLLHCITELSKANHKEPVQLLGSFTSAVVPVKAKNSNSAILYTRLNSMYCHEIDKKNSNYPAVHFKNLVVKLETEFQKSASKNTVFKDLQKSLIKNIYLHPKTAFEVMLSYENKEFIKKIIPLLLNRELLQLIIKTANYKKTKLIQTVQMVYEILNSKERYDLPEELLTDDLLLFSIQEMLLHPEHNSSVFLETVILQLSRKTTAVKHIDYFRFITKLLQSKRIKAFGISIKRSFLIQLKNNNSINIIELALLIQNTSQQAQTSLANVLTTHFHDPKFSLVRKQDKKESDAIIEYFLKNGKSLKTNWIKEKTIWIAKSISVSNARITMDLNEIFWTVILNYNAYKGNQVLFQKLIEKAFTTYAKNKFGIDSQNIEIKKTNEETTDNYLKENVLDIFNEETANDAFLDENTFENPVKSISSESLLFDQKVTAKEKYDWYVSIICQKEIPLLVHLSENIEISDLLNQIIAADTKIFFQILKKEFVSEAQTDWLSRNIHFNVLCTSVSKLDQSKESYLRILEKFYHTLGRITIKGIHAKDLQSLLLRKVLNAAANDNWRLISIDKIWNELIWEVVTKKGISKKSFLMDIEKHIYQFPLSLQLSFREITQVEKQTIKTKKNMEMLSEFEKQKPVKSTKVTVKESIPVRNAGIVLLNSYVHMLFERLNLVHNNEFTSIENQISAAQYLQYVVTGLTVTEENFLPLNKVMCGLPLNQPIPDEIEIPEQNKTLITGLITAAISYWDAIGDCSIDGFRGNWLVRNGLLTEHEERWELVVEKRAYDILISRSPFAFSIIKYPWMAKPLHVVWPY